MKIQISLSSALWTVPEEKDLELEYRYEYLLPSRNWPQRCRQIGASYPLFRDLEDFVQQVRGAKIEPLDDVRVHNMTDYGAVDDVRDLVSGYQFPRDVDRILDALHAGHALPMPIVIRGPKGSWILSGNTRQNLSRIVGTPVQAIWIDVD